MVTVASTLLAVHRARLPHRPNRLTQLPVKVTVYIQTAMDRDYWLSLRIHVSGYSFRYHSHIKSALVLKAGDGFDTTQDLMRHNGYVEQ